MAVDLAYNVSNGQLFFPPGQNQSTGNFAAAQPSGFLRLAKHVLETHFCIDLKLSVSPNVASQASLEAHVIPTVGLRYLSSAESFVLPCYYQISFGLNALDGLAEATVNLDLDTSAKLTLSLKKGATVSTSSNGTSVSSDPFNGCVDVSSTLAVNAGADGSFLNLFDDSTSVSLFSKTFDLFNVSPLVFVQILGAD